MKSIIIYATKYGSVEKAAQMLKGKMEGQVLLVNVIKEKVPSLDQYDNVILGGSIYIGKIQKQLTGYIKENLPLLLKKKVGLFVCAGAEETEAQSQMLTAAFPPELLNQAVAKAVVGYEFHYEKLNFFDKLIMKMVKGITESCSKLSEENIQNFAKAMSGNN